MAGRSQRRFRIRLAGKRLIPQMPQPFLPRTWMDGHATRTDLQTLCAELARRFPFVARLNSQARQASADRAWQAIARFYENCRSKKPGKKGYPSSSMTIGAWSISRPGGSSPPTARSSPSPMGVGSVPSGSLAPETSPPSPSSRYGGSVWSGGPMGIDLGLTSFLTAWEGTSVDNPRFLRKAEMKLKRLHRHLSRTQKRSRNRTKARQQLAKEYLRVSRQREDFARKQASTLITSHDLIAYEALQIRNMVKNHRLAKSISDAAWGRFLCWVRYYGKLQAVPVVAVAPQFTSQDCSGCGQRVEKSLSIRTHRCPGCGLILDRDENAARNILQKALSGTAGQAGTGTPACVPNASGQMTTTV